MKLLTTLGRLLAVPFWLGVLVNLITPFAAPFALLLDLAGAAVLGVHLLHLWACHERLLASPRPTRDRLLVLLFGAFYLDALPAPVLATVVEQPVQASCEPASETSIEATADSPAERVVDSIPA
ncbi:DUF1145 domain-containing protein [Pseudomonas sp. GCM10022188]|uniref:DUF1145 domain-containing protein n=1 Tax=Pseudomonas TaxID=286 RepID=UPI001E4574D4|nr:DUF1145 domain-containing protein [Pseudomonas oryzagri]MCC6075461.1 DUF1145 domain-containing protein [Pseudomonas oryzagri]